MRSWKLAVTLRPLARQVWNISACFSATRRNIRNARADTSLHPPQSVRLQLCIALRSTNILLIFSPEWNLVITVPCTCVHTVLTGLAA